MDTTEQLLPTVTVVTVTYNAERTLPRTLESVAEQAYPHVEHLIVDGCSKDRTMEQIHRYVDGNTGKTHVIQVIREPDRGLYDAMNKALEHATGRYIVFLNAGDRLHEADTLQRLFAPLSQMPCGRRCLAGNGLPSFMARRIVWTARGVSCATGGCRRLKRWIGKISGGGCWSATSRSMCAPTWPAGCLTT